MTRGHHRFDPLLQEGYRQCRRLTWRHGTTYYWGALLLPRRQRRHVYAVYALCRLADDIVDLPSGVDPTGRGWESSWALRQAQGTGGVAQGTGRVAQGTGRVAQGTGRVAQGSDPAERLAAFAAEFRTALAAGGSTDPVMAAVVTTALATHIDPECFDRFFAAMAMDLEVATYETWEDLCGYMEGSAAVIGEMMLPVLEPRSPAAKEPARALGFAFQLTNFIRDVAEDLDRGRIYLPQEDLRRFGVDLTQLRSSPGRTSPEWQACAAYEIARNRELYRYADTGIALLPPRSARCVGAARVLYAQILDRIERADYDVFAHRARVPVARKALTAGRIMVTGPAT